LGFYLYSSSMENYEKKWKLRIFRIFNKFDYF
jgi:hypothetical protein